MASNDLSDWFKSIPIISRYWFAGSVILPLIGRVGLVDPMTMILHYEWLVYKFQIWRPITALFYYPISPMTGFHYLINLYFLYSYSTRLETGVFDGRPADYLFMMVFCWINLVIVALMFNIMLLMDPMVVAVLYVWCQLNKDVIVSFWFGTRFKAMYLPWVLVAFNMIIKGGGLMELVGIFVGHLYFFLMFKYPQDFGGQQFLSTPQFFYRYLPNRRGGVAGFGQAPATRREANDNQANGGHRWGRGQRLDQ